MITGIGFLGAGTIIKHGINIKGLTTAASLWVVAAVGVVVGAGEYGLGVVATAIVLLSLWPVRKLADAVGLRAEPLATASSSSSTRREASPPSSRASRRSAEMFASARVTEEDEIRRLELVLRPARRGSRAPHRRGRVVAGRSQRCDRALTGRSRFAGPNRETMSAHESRLRALRPRDRRRRRLCGRRRAPRRMRRFLEENGLSVFFATFFAVSLTAQSFAGQRNYERGAARARRRLGVLVGVRHLRRVLGRRDGELAVGVPPVHGLHRRDRLARPEGLERVEAARGHRPRDGRAAEGGGARHCSIARAGPSVGGFRRRVYENSLLLAMGLVFLATWLAQSLNNWRTFNDEQRQHAEATVSWGRYLLDPDFWEKTLQNWQSEFLAVGVMVVFTIYLRQRGSPESKPVGAPHDETATSG